MSEGFGVVIGMSIAYVASFMGMFFAWYSYRKRHPKKATRQVEDG